ncbi:zinc finger protein 830 [Galendromus occidentalis]|uniref:Zinc finger protein 830 n=1 Tax=Galendromus occidentalis TaxID=34638 RepID=A0AAJ6VXM9_9ACAR|nr:zinc finger protein 830 [Galendromus occidentalis]
MAGNQEDLRRLMREKMMSSGSEQQSPYAKVSSSGRITCTVCPGVSIKNWSAHQISAQHKRNVSAQKTAKSMPAPAPNKYEAIVKKVPEPPKVAPKSILKNPLKASPSQSDGEVVKPTEKAETLKRPASPPEEQPDTKSAKLSEDGSVLPEGFFDDPKLDAKARNIEYKDPREVEWEMFQKELREEGSKSEQVVEIDEGNDMRERELHEADEMLSKWEKIRELEIRREHIKRVEVSAGAVPMDADDGTEFAEFLDWRQKAVD